MRSQFALKIRIIALIFIVLALVLLVRLYDLQVVHGPDYRAKAEAQYVKQSPNQIDRGSILFTAKDGSLISAATLASGYTITANPSLLKDVEGTYEKLKVYLPDLDKEAYMKETGSSSDTYAEIAHRVPDSTGKAIAQAGIPGIQALRETWRFYPGGSLASQTVGFLGYGTTGTTLTGQYGLERYYDDILTKSTGGLYVNFFADLFTNIRSELSGQLPQGADVVTSIEPSVQQYLERALKDYSDQWHPKIVGGIVMDPATGAIVAMASYPTFDPNDLKGAELSSFTNPSVEDVYEFGSTMKPLTMAAGIDSGAVTPTSTYDDKGFATFDKSTIYNYDKKGRGPGTSMQEVLNQSLNTGIAYVVSKMGTSAFRDYFKKFGITSETGIDLPNEQSPLVENFKSPRTIEYVTAGFGQGIAITPVAMTRALATLANHGMVPAPHVGLELRYGAAPAQKLAFSAQTQAIKPETADTVTKMLVTVVDTALAHGTAKIPEYSVAAKTGTAQVVDPRTHKYYPDKYLHSFFGYFPAYNARYIIFLYANEPVGAPFASETWTTTFMGLVKFLINYYNIPPDRAPAQQP